MKQQLLVRESNRAEMNERVSDPASCEPPSDPQAVVFCRPCGTVVVPWFYNVGLYVRQAYSTMSLEEARATSQSKRAGERTLTKIAALSEYNVQTDQI
jgi:hypothetical protein